MATQGEFAAAKTRGKRGSVCLPSCFRPSPAPESLEAKAGTSTRRRWRLGGKQKTVPVNAVVDAAPLRREQEEAAPTPSEKPRPVKKRSFLHWFRENKGRRIKDPIPIPTNHTQHPTRNSGAHSTSKTQNPRVHQVVSKSRTRLQPVPLYQIHDQAQLTTQTVHPGPVELKSQRAGPSRTCGAPVQKKPGVGEFDSLVGLSVIVVVLTLLLICNWIGAVIFVCTWMYLLPYIRATSKINDSSRTHRKEDENVDMDSTEYKKMIVLKGLLDRDGRRPSSMVISSAH